MKNKYFLVPGLLPLASCFFLACAGHRIDWIQTGPEFPPKKISGVQVFKTKDEPGRPWGAIGLMHGSEIPARDKKIFEKQIRQAQKMAAEHGADAIIIAEQMSENTPDFTAGAKFEPTFFLTGLAIKYIVNISTK